jgi:hypothetical protein
MPTDLRNRILALIGSNPRISTIDICRALRVRKSDVLAELEQLRREQLLRQERGHRGSKCWSVLPEPSTCSCTCSRATPAATSDVEGIPIEREEPP